MLFRELNRGKCKTYLVACEETRIAVLVDPLRDHLERYIAVLAYEGLRLTAVVDTHTHADHRTASFDLRELVGATTIMHRRAPAPNIDRHVDDGDVIEVGKLRVRVLATPGHTPDGISLLVDGRILTGDTILIRGTGRSDFDGGDPAAQYDAITRKIFALPEATKIYPAHDYRGNTCSTVGEEKTLNPRIAGRSKEAYVEIMNNLGLPLPDKIQEVLLPNQTAIDADSMKFPSLNELNHVRQRTAAEVAESLSGSSPPLLLDVREPDEFEGELGHIPGALSLPLRQLAARSGEIEAYKGRPIVVVCRAGGRSTTGAAILIGLGYENVMNLRGGMVDWNDRNLPVERGSYVDG